MEYLGPLAALLVLLHQTGALLKISTSSSHRTFAGSDVLLHCTFSIGGSSPDPRLFVIMWFYQGMEIVKYQEKAEISHPRVSFDERAARGGNASILLSNATFEDEGIYMCSVIYSSEKMEEEIILNVLASPKIQILDKAVRDNNEKTLVCSVSDFYPVDIAIAWLRDGELVRNSSLGKIQRYENGTYSVDSTVTITPNHERKKQTFSCRVRHESLPVPLQEDFQLVYEVQTVKASMIPVIIGVCCAVTLLVATMGIGLLLIWKLKSRKKGGFPLSVIDGPTRLIDGEVVTLSCTGNHCVEDTQVIWLEKKALREPEIIQSHGVDPEKADLLLNTSYVMNTKHMGSQCWSSNLRFTFHVANHKGVTFICRFTSGNKIHEKRFHCTEVYAKPRLVDPVKPSLCVSGEILYSLRLDGFYPRDIQILWTCVSGERQEIISSEEQLVEHSPLTFSVCSEARISEKVFTDPSCKVRVTWEHGSMDQPQSTEMSILDPDFPWRPVVEEIQTPRLFLDVPVQLKCKISGYFPDAVTVNWLIVKGGSAEETLVTDTKSTSITSKREVDLTYSSTAILTVTPSLATHHGAIIKCRVQHPSLEKPKERSTGALRVTAKPCLMEPVTMTLLENGKIQISLCLERFYPGDIEITWRRERKYSKYLLSSTESVTEGNDLTFHVTSECIVSGYVFAEPGNKVLVEWKHESLDVPGCRSWSLRDLPWRPVMEDIIPKLEAGKEAALSCKISGYFPDSLSVQWIKKEKGNESEIKLLLTKGYAIPCIKSDEEKDKTFIQVTRLTFTPHLEIDRGAELICRVTHPTLEEPIEKRTGPLDLPWRPVMEDMIVPKLEAGKEVALSCKISGYFPDSLSVQWIKKKGNESEIKLPIWSIVAFVTREYSDCNVPCTDSNEEEDKTFTQVTRLTFTPHPERDRGAEFICRVTHPTLEEPIEKTTGPLVFNRKPDVSDINCSRNERLYLEVNKFYPRDIEITWRLDEKSGGDQRQYLNSSTRDNGVNIDGTYNITSICEPLGDKMDRSKKYYLKAFVKHVTLKTQEVIKTVRVSQRAPNRGRNVTEQ
uniref:Ig-like domain-containing protein n=1 Tax=Leptobrachium leishanense TaxID=445787 RepID=A0A8C5QR98_9ANUR